MSPKTKEQFEEIRQKSAAGIMQAALELFAHRGFNGTSISQIAKEAGVSKGLIYNYYPSKEALLEAIVSQAFETGEEIIFGNLNVKDPPERQLETLIRAAFSMMKGNIHYWRLITSLTFQPGILEKYEPLMREKGFHNLDLLESLFAAMNRKKPRNEAMALAASMDGLALHFMGLHQEYPFDEMVEYLIEKFCKS